MEVLCEESADIISHIAWKLGVVEFENRGAAGKDVDIYMSYLRAVAHT